MRMPALHRAAVSKFITPKKESAPRGRILCAFARPVISFSEIFRPLAGPLKWRETLVVAGATPIIQAFSTRDGKSQGRYTATTELSASRQAKRTYATAVDKSRKRKTSSGTSCIRNTVRRASRPKMCRSSLKSPSRGDKATVRNLRFKGYEPGGPKICTTFNGVTDHNGPSSKLG